MIAIFTLAALLGAVLVFSVQPMVAKMLLPHFGGAPAVWNAAMLFFQIGLLTGYLYAFVLDRLSSRAIYQPFIHVGLLVSGIILLPIGISSSAVVEGPPALGVVLTLAAVLGLPFLAVSGTAPLLQAWFARTDHHQAHDPYFLYAASNIGSLTALLAYPFVIERVWRLIEQSLVWSVLYGVLALVILLVGWRFPPKAAAPATPSVTPDAGPLLRGLGPWLLFSFLTSALLHGVTIHISTDVAASPLLWVIPLALFLATYIIAFSAAGRWMQRPIEFIAPLMFPLVFVSVLLSFTWALFGHLIAFFVLALACHLRLYDVRPEPARLTAYYLAIAVGGVAGGGFIAVLAPILFTGAYEYPIILGLTLLVLFWQKTPITGPNRGRLWAVAGALTFSALGGYLIQEGESVVVYGALLTLAVGVFVLPLSPRLASSLVGIAFIGFFVGGDWRNAIWQDRSFFGVYRIVDTPKARFLMNGTTLHGGQLHETGERPEPVAYYTSQGPLGDIFALLRADVAEPGIGVIGLGVGNALCYRKDGDRWRAIEIDELVVDIALDEKFFTYVTECGGDVKIEIGDGRQLLAQDLTPEFDLLIVDAFTSDSIPVHLMTREALAVYRAKMRPGGMIAFHISNRHMELAPVIGALALDAKLTAKIRSDPERVGDVERLPSTWVALAAEPPRLGPLDEERWRWLDVDASERPWTDDFSDIVGTIKW